MKIRLQSGEYTILSIYLGVNFTLKQNDIKYGIYSEFLLVRMTNRSRVRTEQTRQGSRLTSRTVKGDH